MINISESTEITAWNVPEHCCNEECCSNDATHFVTISIGINNTKGLKDLPHSNKYHRFGINSFAECTIDLHVQLCDEHIRQLQLINEYNKEVK